MKKLWSGRFSKKTNPMVELFTESISFDYRLAYCDIMGSIAHVKMLSQKKIIPQSKTKKIISGLQGIEKQLRAGKFKLHISCEDIHMNIESALKKKIGPDADYLHTGRSRNDQIQLDTRLYLREAIAAIIELLTNLQKSLINLAEKNKNCILPGVTHLQHAQPVLFAHHMLAYICMFDRDKERLQDLTKRVNIMPLGSGALAGSSLPLDRGYIAKLLGFAKISKNSIDTVSDRDYIIELLSDCAIIGTHLSRLSEEIVLWNSQEFKYIDIDQSFCTGSSLMPQKKNPDIAELVRAKTGRLNGNLIAILTILKGLPLSYNRDLQEDKPPLFDSVETIIKSLSITALLLKNITVNKSHIDDILQKNDLILATDLAEHLVKSNVPFRKAHEAVGKLVSYCLSKNKSLKNLEISELKKISASFKPSILNILNANISVANKRTVGSTNPTMVKNQLKKWKLKLKA